MTVDVRPDVLHVAGDEGWVDPEVASDGQRLTEHLGRVETLPARRRSDVIPDMATDLQQRWRQPMADADPAEELVAVDPPHLGIGDEPLWTRRLLEAPRSKRRDEGSEAFVARQVQVSMSQVAADDRVVGLRPRPSARNSPIAAANERRTRTSGGMRVAPAHHPRGASFGQA